MRVETLEKWAEVSAKLAAHGGRLYMMQYGAGHPEGFHAWFWFPTYSDVEIVTHNPTVQAAIIKYSSGQ